MKYSTTEPGLFGDLLHLLAKPAQRALYNASITTFAQLGNYSDKELLKLHGFGPNALNKVRSFQAAKGSSSPLKD